MTHHSVLVTGAAAGIGRAVARHFLAEGWQVGAIDRDAHGLKDLAEEAASARLWTQVCDVADGKALSASIAGFMTATGGRLDLLVNNAGVLVTGDFEAVAPERYDALIDVNIKAVVRGCHAALPFLMTTPGARVINLCSASAAYGTPAFAVYSASKFAVRGLTEALDAEWRRHGVRVMAVWPLFVGTNMLVGHEQRSALQRMGVHLGPEDVARVVARAARCPRWWPQVHWSVGLRGAVSVLALRFLPVWINRLIVRKLADY